MANHLKVAMVNAILTLHRRGWSNRRIARELGVHRETVGRYIRRAGQRAKPANAPLGSEGDQLSKPANAPSGSAAADGDQEAVKSGASGPISRCEPWRKVILAKLESDLSAQRIYQDLVTEYSFEGSYYSVRRFVRRLGQSRPLPFRRMECQPGQEAQVDLGKGAPVERPNGRKKRPYVFRISFSFSRKAYSEVVWRQDTETFIRCLENAFWHFGGVPKTLVVDNLKAAVIKADWYDPDLNPKIQSFCEHYGTVILPTKSYTPRHKGKIERQIDYVQNNGLKGLQFAGLGSQNRYLLNWETNVADTRIHGTTRRQVGKVFLEEEKPVLLPLPSSRFPCFNEDRRSVHRDGHIEVDKAYYSVPPEYLGQRLWVRWDGRLVRIFNERFEQIAIHAQGEFGRFSTKSQHIASEKICAVERGTTYLLRKVRLIGPETDRWAQAMLQQRGIQGVRVLVGLISLTGRHPSECIEKACEIALSHGAFRLRVIRELIKRTAAPQQQFEFVQRHQIIRNMREYGELVKASFRSS